MFGIGGFELFIILVFGFLIFGPDKLPEIAKTVGKGIARFREAQQEMNDTLGGEKIFDPDNPDEPFKDPVEVLDRIAQKQGEKKAGKKAAGTPAKPKPANQQATGKPGEGSADKSDDAPRQESFTERKARYERERAARRAAEAEAEAGAGAEAEPEAADASAGTGADTPAADGSPEKDGSPDAPARSEGGDA